MESAVTSNLRRLCRAVSEEKEDESDRMQSLLNELLQLLEERQFVSLLL